MLSLERPFILFDDARVSGAAHGRHYHDMRQQLHLKTAEDIYAMPDKLRDALSQGYHVAGYLSYEAGLLLEARTASLTDGGDYGWFGIFESYDIINDIMPMLPDGENLSWGELIPEINQSEYMDMFDSIQNYIRQGDIYQANLTFRCSAKFAGNPLSLYAALRSKAAAGYGGIMNGGGAQILSFSPELFFTLKDKQIIARPMKGTAEVLPDEQANYAAIENLRDDPKQRAENLMIVDLLRNDLSKICAPSSVKVPQLFHVETYPTVHQMTSTICGTLSDGKDALDILTHIFPCGSITGAPKIRAMEIIDALEISRRNAYCGSMGWIDPNGDAAFNVAIRSLSMQHGADRFTMGLGSGIVADSNAADEWAECLAKAAFIAV